MKISWLVRPKSRRWLVLLFSRVFPLDGVMVIVLFASVIDRQLGSQRIRASPLARFH